MPCKKKKYNARFPPARIKKIMQTDEDVGKVAAAVPVIISRSLELFIDSLIERTATITTAKNAKTLSTSHIKQAIYSEKTFDFLRDLVKNIPDHQVDEDGEGSASGGAPQEKKPKPNKPRKPREDGAPPRGRGRPRKIKPEPEVKKESSSNEEDDDEETESDEEQNLHMEPTISDRAPSTNIHSGTPLQQDPTQQGPSQQGPVLQGQSEQAKMQQGPSQQGPVFQGPSQQGPSNLDQVQQGPSQQDPQQGPCQQVPVHQSQAPQQYFSPPQCYPANLASSPNAIPSVQSSFTPPSANMTNEQCGNPQYNPMLMTQRPFQQQPPYPMHNYPFPQYVMPPGAPHMGPPQFLPPGTSSNMVPQPNLSQNMPSQIPPCMPPYSPNIPGMQSFTGTPGQDNSSNGFQPVPYNTSHYPPPYSAGHQTVSPSNPPQTTGHQDTNMPIDMSIGGNPRLMASPMDRTNQQAVLSQGVQHPYAPCVQVYNSPPTLNTDHRSSPSNPRNDQAHPQTANQLQGFTDSEPIVNKLSPVSQNQIAPVAVVTREVTPPKLSSQDKDKSLVSFPGLSNIMKINSAKPVNNNEDDDDYDT